MRVKRLVQLRGWWTVPLLAVASLGAAGGEVPLIEAVKKADTEAVRALLQQQIDVNTSEGDGMTALHWAARLDGLETADLLIRAGADVKAANRFGVTPLSLACTNGNAAMVERLLEAGADPNTVSPQGETVLMTAARTGRADAVKALLARGADVNAKERWRGQTALMWAAAEGHAAAAQALIEGGVDNKADIDARSNGGWSSLLLTVREGHLDAVRVLLAAGANPNDAVKGNTQGGGYGARGQVGNRAQLPGNDGGTSVLTLAIINAHYELAALLLENGADPNAPDPRGSALHALAFIRRPGSGTPPNPTGTLDSLDLAEALLKHGANPNVRISWKEIKFDRDAGVVRQPPNISIGRNYMSFIGATPFYVAAKHGDVALMRLLAAYGADPLATTVQKVTPLMVASGLGFWDGESPGPVTGVPDSERLEAVKLAVELGNDINAVTDFGDIRLEGDGVTLLRRMALNLEEYSEKFPDNALGDMRFGGSTALHGAALAGFSSIVSFLVEKGARVDARNTLGWTPLMIAEGIFVANTEKDWPSTAAMLRQMMTERGLSIEGNRRETARPDVRPQ